jgi:hypothetical protein
MDKQGQEIKGHAFAMEWDKGNGYSRSREICITQKVGRGSGKKTKQNCSLSFPYKIVKIVILCVC